MDKAVPHGEREPMLGLRPSPSSANTGQPDFVEDTSHTGGLECPGLTCYDPDDWYDVIPSDPYDWDDDSDEYGESCSCPLFECNCHLWRSAKGLALLGQFDRDAENEHRDEQRKWRRQQALQASQRRRVRRDRRS